PSGKNTLPVTEPSVRLRVIAQRSGPTSLLTRILCSSGVICSPLPSELPAGAASEAAKADATTGSGVKKENGTVTSARKTQSSGVQVSRVQRSRPEQAS